MAQSQEGYLGIAKQVASGTYVTPAKYLYANSIDISPDDSLIITDSEIGGGRDIVAAYSGTLKYSGSVEFNLRPEAVGYFILGVMGSSTSSGIGAGYGHTFKFAGTVPPLSIEKKVGSNLEVFGYTDVKVNSFRIECAAGEVAKGSVELIAINETSGKTAQAATFEIAPVFTFAGGKVTLEGTDTSVKNVSFEIKNNIVDDDFRIGSKFLGQLQERRRELSAAIDVVPTNSNIYKKATYGSEGATVASGLQQTYSGALHLSFETADGVYIPSTTTKYTMDIDIPIAVFKFAPLTLSGDDLIVETLDLLPIKGTLDIATITLRNSTASY